MPSPGLPPEPTALAFGEQRFESETLLQVDLHDRVIQDAAGPLADLGDPLIGRPLAELWRPGERLALDRRLDDAILLGRDCFGAIALVGGRAWVEVDVAYDYRRGQRLALRLRQVLRPPSREGPAPDSAVPPEPAPGRTESPGGVSAAPPAEPAVSSADRRAARETLVLEALRTAGAAALWVGPSGSIEALTPVAERLLGRPAALLLGRSIEALLRLGPEAGAALQAAREAGLPQSVLAQPAEGGGSMALDWLPGAEPGAGHAILTAPQSESPDRERTRFQTQLVSSVAHDVRDSIAAVYCGLHTLAQELPEDSPLQDLVAQALEESERASRITEDVLWISRPSDLKRIELDLDTVVHEALSRYRKRAAGASIELEARLQSGCQVMADLSSLERLVGNLVENALDATPPGGALCVTTRAESRGQPGACLSVRDTGIGIKEETRPNVFDPFFTDKHGGTGLGLAIARRVVFDHSGQIHFDSKEGEGTTFHVWLPACEI